MDSSVDVSNPQAIREFLMSQLVTEVKLGNEILRKLPSRNQKAHPAAKQPSLDASSKEPQQDTAQRKAEQKALRGQLALHRKKIADLKRQFNEQAGILRLPLVFLQEVSLYFVAHAIQENITKHPKTETGFPVRSQPCRWIRIGHVSRRWREAVLASPKMWSSIMLSKSTPYVLEMLSRSQKVSLDIWSGQETISEETYQAVFLHMPRIRRLDFELGLSLNSGDPILPSEAPVLQSLTLRHKLDYMRSMYLWQRTLVSTAKLLSALESCDMPSLQHLALCDASALGLRSPLFRPTLTTLILDRVKFDTDRAPVERVLGLLATLPLLEDLQLINSLGAEQPPDLVLRSVSLPNLGHLRLALAPWALTTFLQCLKFPCAAAITLRCPNYPFTDYDPVIAALKTHWSQAGAARSAGPLLTASIFSEPPQIDYAHRSTRLVCWRSCIPVDKIGTPQQHQTLPKPALDITFDIAQTFAVCGFLTCDALLLPDLQSLSLVPIIRELDLYPDESHWRQVFATMTDLRELRVARWGAENTLTKALAVEVSNTSNTRGGSSASSSTAPGILIPRLEVLSLTHADFDARTYLQVLQARKNRRMQLRILDIKECCRFGAEDVASFQKVVKAVKWDGVDRNQSWGYEEAFSEDEEEEADRKFDEHMRQIEEDLELYGYRSRRSRRCRYSDDYSDDDFMDSDDEFLY